jgi:hypothetical protein
MADKCTWVKSSRGKKYPCSKGPFGEPADAYEPYSPFCREHYEMYQRHKQTYGAKRRLELAADPVAATEARGAEAERKRSQRARNRELAPGALGDLQALTDDERVRVRDERVRFFIAGPDDGGRKATYKYVNDVLEKEEEAPARQQ